MDLIMTLEQAFTILIENFPNIGITGVLAFLIWYIIAEHGKSNKRDDDFRLELLKVAAQQSSLFERHEQAAKERAAEQERLGKERDARDRERVEISRKQTEALAKITEHLNIVDATKSTVDTIHAAQVHLQGSVSDLGTDLTGVVNRRAAENLEVYKTTVRDSFQLVEAALIKVNQRLDDMVTQDNAAVAELRAISTGLETLKELLKQAQQLPQEPIPPLPLLSETLPHAGIEPQTNTEDTENKKSA